MMTPICDICKRESGSHSFYKMGVYEDASVYYSCPAKATKYYDKEGILGHYDATLNENGEKPWVWIFDCSGFTFLHAMQISVAIGLAKLIESKYSKNLRTIYIINSNWWINISINAVYPFLAEETKSKIVLKTDDFSVV